jgi:DNA (cytosine-5)-methyltransferase 1
MTVVGQVEIDPFCRQVLAKHWPEVPRHDDVRTCAEWWLSTDRPAVDLIAGGFPCQDISNAGQRAGIDGERSGLWFTMADVIRDLRPPLVLLENVSDLLVRGLDRVLGTLAEIGYDAEWDCIPAAAVGAHHRRDRWFAVAYPTRDRCGQGRPGGPPGHGPDRPGVWPQTLADAPSAGRGQQRALGSLAAVGSPQERPGQAEPGRRSGPRRVFGQWPTESRWPTEPAVGRVVDGIPSRVVRPQLRALGNAVVPQVAEHIGRLIMAAHRGQVTA